MSDNDVPIEKIANLVGHRTTVVTQTVYRHQLRPVIETGATTMNTIFKRQKAPDLTEVWPPRSAPVLAPAKGQKPDLVGPQQPKGQVTMCGPYWI